MDGPSGTDIWREAQRLDEWPGENPDEGTSVRAGAKALAKVWLRLANYHFAFTLDEVVAFLLTTGPVVMGTNWYTAMFSPNSSGLVKIGGVVEGGHAWLLTGVNKMTGKARAINSWGLNWGRKGWFWLKLDDLGRLLEEQGEAAAAVERRPIVV
jgi:hypothetical protein